MDLTAAGAIFSGPQRPNGQGASIPLWFQQRTDRPSLFGRLKYKGAYKWHCGWSLYT
jgi:hypothetical protein